MPMMLTFSVEDREQLTTNLREMSEARIGHAPYGPLNITLFTDDGYEHLVTRVAVIHVPMPAVLWARPEIGEEGVIALDRLVKVRAYFVGGFSLKETDVEEVSMVERGAGVP